MEAAQGNSLRLDWLVSQPAYRIRSVWISFDRIELAQGTECHQILVEEWSEMEAARGTLFVSIPSLLDEGVSPPGTHLMHVFTPDWVVTWTVCAQPCPFQLPFQMLLHVCTFGKCVRMIMCLCATLIIL